MRSETWELPPESGMWDKKSKEKVSLVKAYSKERRGPHHQKGRTGQLEIGENIKKAGTKNYLGKDCDKGFKKWR